MQDLRFFKSQKTDRGPLVENWQSSTSPIMCSYKLVEASFEVWGMQTKSEDLIQKVFIFSFYLITVYFRFVIFVRVR